MNFRYHLGTFFPLLKKINKLNGFNKDSVTRLNYHGIPDEFMPNFKLHIHWLVKNYV